MPIAAIHEGDCLDVLPTLGRDVASFAYLDPPFGTGRVQTGRDATQRFDDPHADLDAWLDWFRPRLRAAIDVLRPDALLCVHVDWRSSHLVRCALDDACGRDGFVNHLVWSYGLGGSGPRSFARKHDDLLLYATGRDYWFEAPRVPATSARLKGRTKKATDVLAIPALNNMARERTGWPTQKPLALLDLLVRACCPPGGTVLDPFCGSGTTLAAALAAERSAVGIDASAEACAIARGRVSGHHEGAKDAKGRRSGGED